MLLHLTLYIGAVLIFLRPTTTKMKQLVNAVLQEKLEKATYQSDRCSVLTKEIADAVKAKLKGNVR